MRRKPELLVDECHGIYVPQNWAVRYGEHAISYGGIDRADVEALIAGPDAESYWEIWDDIIRDYRCVSFDGTVWRLWQDGDLWAMPEGVES